MVKKTKADRWLEAAVLAIPIGLMVGAALVIAAGFGHFR